MCQRLKSRQFALGAVVSTAAALLGLASSALASSIVTQDASRAHAGLHLLNLAGQQGIAHTQVDAVHATSSAITFTSASLAGADVVYLSPSYPGALNLSAAEILTLESFVNGGGRLILAADYGAYWNSEFVSLALQFGVTYGGGTGSSGPANVVDFLNPVSNGPGGVVNSFSMLSPSTGVSSSGPDFVSVAAGPDTQTALGYLKPGAGRLGEVVFLTDFNTFDDSGLGNLDNNTLWTNLFAYTAVPEPSTALLLVSALLGMGVQKRRLD